MNLKLKALTKSIWVFHLACSPCNNCDIEILDVLTPRFDVERFGIQLIGSIRHADCLLITGFPNYKTGQRLKELYRQVPKPCLIAAIGSCALGSCIFKESYNRMAFIDEIVPVDVYIPGCPPKPEAIIAGVVKGLEKLKQAGKK